MARTVRDSRLENRSQRDKLPLGKIQWRTITPKVLHVGFRRKRKGEAGQWIVRHYLGNGHYMTETLGAADDFADADGQSVLSYSQAQKIALDMAPTARRAGTLTVDQVMADYVSWLKVHKASGKRVEQRAALYIAPTIGNIRVADLTTDHIREWHEGIANSPARIKTAPGMPQNVREAVSKDQKRARRVTANMMLSFLKAALNKAYMAGKIDSNVAWTRAKAFAKVDRPRDRILDITEAKRLINAADETSGFRDLVHAALLTGCRYQELARLRVGDFQHNKILIRESKSGKSRWVRLNQEGVHFFEAKTAGRAKDALVLPRNGPNNVREWNHSEQIGPMEETCRAASIDPRITFHGLRHTWASLAVMRGVPLMVVADNLGHCDTKMVEKHYGHLAQNYMDDAIMAGAPSFGVQVPETNVRRLRK
jgi:integrase